jgi:hypothetical protein
VAAAAGELQWTQTGLFKRVFSHGLERFSGGERSDPSEAPTAAKGPAAGHLEGA